ncbi:MAG: hypothetical protein IJP63_03355 [Acholeplasmatales bacterium]|nr:hypothetical protein [Acholeplasmatales bacterium]
MDYFDDYDKKLEEKDEKDKYINNFKKQALITKIILASVFTFLGILFIILAFVLKSIEEIIFYIYLPLGGSFIIFAVISFIICNSVNPDKAYERYKKRKNSGRLIYSSFEISTRILSLEREVKNLKEEVERLKR